MRRHEVSDQEWELLKELLPPRKRPGRPPTDARKMLNGMLWILNTGAPWRDLPERYGPWRTVYDRFNLWSRDGTLDRMLAKLQLRLDAKGLIDWDLFCIDGSVVRASRAAAGARKKTGPASR
jgi:transposase